MGSFGLGFSIGKSWLSRIIGFVKSKGVNIPDYQLAVLAGSLLKEGHQVEIKSVPGNADAYYIHTSLNGCIDDIKMAKKLKNVYFIGAMAHNCKEMYEPYGKIIDVDRNQLPAWNLYDYKKFRYFPSLKKGPVVPIVTAYGCKYKCSYCPYSSYYGEWTPRPLEDVLKEIELDVTLYKIKGIIFRDPLFTADRERTKEILKQLMYFDLSFACETRIEKVNIELLDLMKLSGCEAIHFGIESANDKVLKSVNRTNPSKETMKTILDYCEHIGIKTTCFFILGFPEDNEKTVQETIDLSIYLNPNIAEFFVSTPYPGTKLSKEVKLTKEYKDMTGYNLCFEHKVFTADKLEKIRERAYKRFYLRLFWLIKFIGF